MSEFPAEESKRRAHRTSSGGSQPDRDGRRRSGALFCARTGDIYNMSIGSRLAGCGAREGRERGSEIGLLQVERPRRTSSNAKCEGVVLTRDRATKANDLESRRIHRFFKAADKNADLRDPASRRCIEKFGEQALYSTTALKFEK